MDLNYWATTVAPLVQSLTSLAAVLGLYLVWYQIKVTNQWNRANTQHQLLSNLPSQELEEHVWNLVESLSRDHNGRLEKSCAATIYAHVENWVAVRTYLNKFEQLCTAVNAKALDNRYAYDMHGAKVIDAFRTFEYYIEYARERARDGTIYLELEMVATDWRTLTESEELKVRAKHEELKRSRSASPVVK